MTTRIVTATIPAGQSMSNGVDCSGSLRIVRFVVSPAWTAAPITFQMSPDNVGYHNLYHVAPGSLTAYEVTVPSVTAGAVLAFPPGTGATVNWIKLRSGTQAVPVNQVASRTFEIVLEDVSVVEGPTGPAGLQGPTGAPGATGPTGTFNLKGVVDASNAAPGNIGEVVSGGNATGISLVTNLPANLITLHLTPGDWNVASVTTFTPVGTGPNGLASGITLTSGTLPSDAEVTSGVGILNQLWASSMPSGKVQNIPTSLVRVNTNVPKDVFLVVMASFGGGTVTATGYMSARRIR